MPFYRRHAKFARRSSRMPLRRPRYPSLRSSSRTRLRPPVRASKHGSLLRRQDRLPNAFKQYQMTGFPTRLNFDMPFSEFIPISLLSGLGGIGGTEQIYRLNAPYDPRYSGGGLSAEGWTKYLSIYGHYMCTHVDVEFTFFDSTTATLVAFALLQPGGGTATLTGWSPNQLLNDSTIQSYKLNAASSGDLQQTGASFRVNLWELEGLTYQQYCCNLAQYGSMINGNPTLTPLLRLAAADMNGVGAAACFASIKIIHHGFFYSRDIPINV